MSFGGHLRALRGEARLSRAELARRAGVPVGTLRNWENDRGFPGVPAFLRLAEALGVTAERLAEELDDAAGNEEEPAREPLRRARNGRQHRAEKLLPRWLAPDARDHSRCRGCSAPRAGPPETESRARPDFRRRATAAVPARFRARRAPGRRRPRPRSGSDPGASWP